MSIALSQSYSAIAGGLTASFLATGGTAPYTYSALTTPLGPGGTINSSTGLYTAPAAPSPDPQRSTDTIRVVDNVGAATTASILVGTPLQLFCDIIQHEMGLAPGRVYLWDQKIMQPTDSGLYVAVSSLREKVFASSGRFNGSTNQLDQSANVMATLQMDVISRGPAARDQKELVLMTLASVYAEQQMEKNSFFVGKLPAGSEFVNLSSPDGAAIPYRFKIDVNMQFMVRKSVSVQYFDAFSTVSVVTNP